MCTWLACWVQLECSRDARVSGVDFSAPSRVYWGRTSDVASSQLIRLSIHASDPVSGIGSIGNVQPVELFRRNLLPLTPKPCRMPVVAATSALVLAALFNGEVWTLQATMRESSRRRSFPPWRELGPRRGSPQWARQDLFQVRQARALVSASNCSDGHLRLPMLNRSWIAIPSGHDLNS